jgi:hypothetical protein
LIGTVVEGQTGEESLSEPLAADLRIGGDSRLSAKLKIITALLGVSFDDLRQRDHARQQRRLAAVGFAATVRCVVRRLGGCSLGCARGSGAAASNSSSKITDGPAHR